MFGKELFHDEVYFKEYGEYKIASSYTVYEAYIEEMHDKDGKLITNKDGSPRYRYVREGDIVKLENDKEVKEIRNGLYKDVFEVNGDKVELVERENKRIYYVVDNEKIKTLNAGTALVLRNGLYRELGEVGYILVDDYDVENPKVVAVRKFKTEDHEQEAKDIVASRLRRNNDND